jgi:hypothetical protein
VSPDPQWIPSGDGSGIDGPLGHPNVAFCICGEAWFRLDGALSLDQDGAIEAYTGRMVCVSCGVTKPEGFSGDHPWQFRSTDGSEDEDDE